MTDTAVCVTTSHKVQFQLALKSGFIQYQMFPTDKFRALGVWELLPTKQTDSLRWRNSTKE